MEFEFGLGPALPARRRDEDPMRILVLGDFSGRGQRSSSGATVPLAQRPQPLVDVDTFDALLARYAPALELTSSTGADAISIVFKHLDDFHPDALYRRLPLFEPLREMRDRLANPATFGAAAAELSPPAEPPKPIAEETKPPTESDAALLERLLGKPASAPKPPVSPEIDAFIRRIVEPHIQSAADPRQPAFLAGADQAIGEAMRGVLHHPAFQALESAWRGLHALATHLATGSALRIHLLDATRHELLEDVRAAATNLGDSDLFRLLVEPTRGPGGKPWSLLVGNYSFGTDPEDIALLAALGALGAQAGGPFLGAAKAEVLGCRALWETPDPTAWRPLDGEAERRWQALRASWMAAWLGLVAPRVLLRLPYGRKGEPMESFAFEEIVDAGAHESYLWGNPAPFAAFLIAQAFAQDGWSMQPGDCLDVEDLPAYTHKTADGAVLQPCAEVLLPERAAQAMLERGIMPFMSYRNRNAVRLARFQSLASPAAALAGPWT